DDTDVVDSPEVGAVSLEVRRILNKAVYQKKRHDTDRDVDVEDPVPAVVVREPAANSRTNRGRQDGNETVKREGQSAFAGLERVGHDGLRHGLQSASAGTLQDAKQQQESQRRSQPA